jgi:hypothetical protein
MIADAPVGLVSRTRLLDLLDQAPDHALVLVCAPPGYGKTSLLPEWVAHRVPTTAAWLTLDEDDNDPRRLWCAVLAAMSTCAAVPDDSALRRLAASPSASLTELAGEVVGALDGLPEPVRLVLDNVDELLAPAVQNVLRPSSGTVRAVCGWCSQAGWTRRCRCPGCGWRGGCTRSGPISCASLRPRQANFSRPQALTSITSRSPHCRR